MVYMWRKTSSLLRGEGCAFFGLDVWLRMGWWEGEGEYEEGGGTHLCRSPLEAGNKFVLELTSPILASREGQVRYVFLLPTVV